MLEWHLGGARKPIQHVGVGYLRRFRAGPGWSGAIPELLFGQANLQHVGRGLSYLLPVIQLGLVADPLRFKTNGDAMPLADYAEACPRSTHCAFEEPEAHLHPKVQSRLAHWFVALAMAERQILVETHSDHMVRRLRGLAARAKPGSALETWLLENVRVLQVEQQDGKSTVKQATLTAQGGLEDWPHDFMDAATDEERSIYDASLDKPSEPEEPLPNTINVSAFGSSDRDKAPGEIHHVPKDKAHLLKPNAGWTCPPED